MRRYCVYKDKRHAKWYVGEYGCGRRYVFLDTWPEVERYLWERLSPQEGMFGCVPANEMLKNIAYGGQGDPYFERVAQRILENRA